MFTIDIHANGEPSIHTDTIAVHKALGHLAIHSNIYVTHKNDGVLVTMLTDRTEARRIVRDIRPDAGLRIVRQGLRIRVPAAIVARHASLYAVWSARIAAGDTFVQARNVVINHRAA